MEESNPQQSPDWAHNLLIMKKTAPTQPKSEIQPTVELLQFNVNIVWFCISNIPHEWICDISPIWLHFPPIIDIQISPVTPQSRALQWEWIHFLDKVLTRTRLRTYFDQPEFESPIRQFIFESLAIVEKLTYIAVESNLHWNTIWPWCESNPRPWQI